MLALQVAIEAWGADHGGMYPASLDSDMKRLLAVEQYPQNPTTCGLLNPATGKHEWPSIEPYAPEKDYSRHSTDRLGRGVLELTLVRDRRGNGIGYIIRAGDPVSGRVACSREGGITEPEWYEDSLSIHRR